MSVQHKFTRALYALVAFVVLASAATAHGADVTQLVPEKYKSAPVVIGTTATMPPVESVDSATSQIVGIEPDLARAIAKKLGVKVEIQNVAFDGLLAGMQAGRYDIAMSGLGDTVQRQQAMDFVDWYASGLQFVVLKGNPKKVAGLDTLCGLALGSVRASSQYRQVEAIAKNCGSKDTPLLATETSPSGLLLVKTARVDAFAVDAIAAPNYAKASPELEVVPGQHFPFVRGPAFAKSNVGLRDAWQAGLKAVIDSGEYDEILKRWGVPEVAYKKATINGGTE